jgi:sigma-54 dependent transcriptional regulator, acetoin dehydrogenase operon transcriptional activator AcoR
MWCRAFKEIAIYPIDNSGQSLSAWTGGSSHVVSKLEPQAERQVMMAWERFVTGEPLTDAHVSKLLLSSWQRSARAGVAPSTRVAPLVARGDALEHLRRSNHDLLWAAKSLFMNSAHLLERSGSIMMLTDPHGVVLETAGDKRTLDAAQDIHLIAGGNWHEDVVGTNGIGTALAMRRPIQVHAAEHFGEGIKSWTCTAAPVFLPGTEQILGVIDISGPPSTYQGNNLVLAVSMARQIEAALIERANREHIYLLEASLKFSGSSDAAVLMVLDRHAKLIHARGSVPGLALHLGVCLPGLEAGCQVEEWARRLPEGMRPEWLHPVIVDGATIGALLVVPKRARGNIAGLQLAGVSNRLENESEIDPSRSSFTNLRGNSLALRTAIDRARQLSSKRVAVLIQGETGVGKELFARAIHGDEQRSGPFVIFNCGTTSKELIASELFGHVRGAYTGATNEGRAGRFELAHGGTLCLDEIGELPLDLQPVLLRALEEGVVCRLGDSKPHRVDVRLLAMTNRDLLKEVEAGRFRRDLYHRINVTSVRVPPLRERELDIEPLISHFNSSLAARHGVPSRDYGADVMALLRAYAWPGNVRELRNVVESLLLTSSEAQVRCHELPEELLSAVGSNALVAAVAAIQTPASSIEEAERLAITFAVKNMHGNLTQAARALGVSRSTLYRKVERYHLEGIVHLVDDAHEAGDSKH